MPTTTHPLRPILGAAALATAVAATPLAAAPLTQVSSQEFTWSGSVSTGDAVEIRGVNGPIRAEVGSGGQVELVATKRGRRSDPDEVTIEVIEHAGGVTICSVYPSTGNQPNECVPGGGGRMNTRNNDVQVEFVVRVPDGVDLIGRTVNGEIEVIDLDGDVDVSTTNGDIRVSTTGMARATTTNGGIDVEMGAVTGSEGFEFRTTNGDITVTVTGDLDADLRARTTNGRFYSDFPLMVQGRFGARQVDGVIGDGGPLLELTTTNGDVSLRQR